MADLSALQAAIKLVADAVKDTDSVVSSGSKSPLAALLTYENLVPDFLSLAPELALIPSEISAMAPGDYLALAESLMGQLQLSNAHAEAVIKAAMAVLAPLVALFPSLEALIAAIQGK